MTLGTIGGLAGGFLAGAALGIPGLALAGGVALAVGGALGAGALADKIQGIDRPPLTPEQRAARTERMFDYIEEQNRRNTENLILFDA